MRNFGITILAVIGLLLGWFERSHAAFAADATLARKPVVVRMVSLEPSAARASD